MSTPVNYDLSEGPERVPHKEPELLPDGKLLPMVTEADNPPYAGAEWKLGPLLGPEYKPAAVVSNIKGSAQKIMNSLKNPVNHFRPTVDTNANTLPGSRIKPKEEKFRGTSTEIKTVCEVCGNKGRCSSRFYKKWICTKCLQAEKLKRDEQNHREKLARLIGLEWNSFKELEQDQGKIKALVIPPPLVAVALKSKLMTNLDMNALDSDETVAIIGMVGKTAIARNNNLPENKIIIRTTKNYDSSEGAVNVSIELAHHETVVNLVNTIKNTIEDLAESQDQIETARKEGF